VKERTAEVEQQKQIIETKNERITASINYSKHIQDSLLKDEDEIRLHLPELFILYLPKDIVSGDFYWFAEIEELSILAVADCTGHGVPGAFMTMIGTILLNEIVKDHGITNPALILQELHKSIYESLRQHRTNDLAQDGMDISVCVIDRKQRILSYAGAKNDVYILHNGEMRLLKADRYSIGGKYLRDGIEDRVFSKQSVKLEKDMQVYMLSDGILDQFGGANRNKFGAKRFKETLSELNNLPMAEQKEILQAKLSDWKSNYPQTDDILIIGVRIEG